MAKRSHPAHRMSQYGPDKPVEPDHDITSAAAIRSKNWIDELDFLELNRKLNENSHNFVDNIIRDIIKDDH